MARDGFGAFGGGHFVAEPFVFGLVVEEFVVAEGDDFGDGKDVLVGFCAQDAAVELAAIDAFFNEYLAVFGEGLPDGGKEVGGSFDFCGGDAAAPGGGFDKEGVVHPGGSNLVQ